MAGLRHNSPITTHTQVASMSANPNAPRTNALINLFMAHPESVDEGYFEHMRFAATFGFWLALAAGAAFIHAILPFACEKTASSIIKRLHAKIVNRGAQPQ